MNQGLKYLKLQRTAVLSLIAVSFLSAGLLASQSPGSSTHAGVDLMSYNAIGGSAVFESDGSTVASFIYESSPEIVSIVAVPRNLGGMLGDPQSQCRHATPIFTGTFDAGMSQFESIEENNQHLGENPSRHDLQFGGINAGWMEEMGRITHISPDFVYWATTFNEWQERFLGSGIVIDRRGFLIADTSIFADVKDTERICVKLSNGESFPIGSKTDLANGVTILRMYSVDSNAIKLGTVSKYGLSIDRSFQHVKIDELEGAHFDAEVVEGINSEIAEYAQSVKELEDMLVKFERQLIPLG